MKKAKRVFITDCEGPISKNDNAFELACHFIPEGDKFFTQISTYDDVLADVVKRDGYKAGDTLKLIVPFLKACEVTNRKMMEFSAQNILLIPDAKDMLRFVKGRMPSFIVSTSYEHYIQVLCRTLDFPYKNTYCTALDIDAYQMGREEKEKLDQFRREICSMPLIEIPKNATSLQDFSERDQQTMKRLDKIFWREIMQMESGTMLKEINPVGGVEKAKAVRSIVDEAGSNLSSVMYIGDSITDVDCFRLVRENGGATVSFNGNAYAIREAEIAVLSTNALVVATIADVFERLGKEVVYDLVDNWGYKALEKYGSDSLLQEKLQNLFPKMLPKVSKITARNVEELAAESSVFRKLVRGENVGRLG
ncbi:HAD hydrolase family protein [Candidatus Bathyarchaeota archaeon]|nr:HAD hydrolase family protein [Candidatus Bathyarchaeota archaeon]